MPPPSCALDYSLTSLPYGLPACLPACPQDPTLAVELRCLQLMQRAPQAHASLLEAAQSSPGLPCYLQAAGELPVSAAAAQAAPLPCSQVPDVGTRSQRRFLQCPPRAAAARLFLFPYAGGRVPALPPAPASPVHPRPRLRHLPPRPRCAARGLFTQLPCNPSRVRAWSALLCTHMCCCCSVVWPSMPPPTAACHLAARPAVCRCSRVPRTEAPRAALPDGGSVPHVPPACRVCLPGPGWRAVRAVDPASALGMLCSASQAACCARVPCAASFRPPWQQTWGRAWIQPCRRWWVFAC